MGEIFTDGISEQYRSVPVIRLSLLIPLSDAETFVSFWNQADRMRTPDSPTLGKICTYKDKIQIETQIRLSDIINFNKLWQRVLARNYISRLEKFLILAI